ncbi:exodeoxyribonuclease V subunit gamma [Fodinibius sp. Rm-B-1B1-1]|uniref:exodeoxyribonuclease V subunit gamma n=1 Tax=Fodinibius alkaliphilus TaxID=3140241 RepID=UPI00315A914F
MLKFYYGTELEKLADKLFNELDDQKPQNPLAKETFVVQNNGIGQWLSLRMARQEGIAANLTFEFPSERIWSLIRQCNPDIPEDLPSDRGPMTWTLMNLLSDPDFLDEFEKLHHYIRSEDPEQQAMRSWKLASKIADVFDQYLMYRPQMILGWEEGKDTTQNSTAEKWQAQLWCRLMTYWENNYEGDALHRAQLLQELWDKIDNGNLGTDSIPDRISVFGVSSASPAFIKTMVKLSKCTEVHFYHLAINPKAKASEDFQNPLLQSFGTEGVHFMSLFSKYVKAEQKVADNRQWTQVGNTKDSTDTLFEVIQKDVTKDHPPSKGKEELEHIDSSIQVHNCHSPMREVEVLYDQLLALLDKNPSLDPEDILIMTPDIERYSPMIEAVFGTPDEGQPEIPYAIADRSVTQSDSITQTFTQILNVVESRFKVTDVLDLLDSNAIRTKFELTEDHLNRIEQWVSDNKIRWGIDGENKKQIGLPQSDHFTWRSGLRRVLLGYMMRPSEDQLYDNIFAYNEIERSEDADLAGRLSAFLNHLFEINETVDKPKTPDEWQNIFNRVFDDLLPDSRDFFWEVSQIRETINALVEHARLGGHQQKISFAIIRRWLDERLQKKSTGGGRIGQGVTFCSLMPMRSIPFSVIGMIGMNEDAFPRSSIPIEFDLMHLDTQVGDPVQAQEDRYLFLENLLSARTNLYFSYVGQSNRQDAEFPPSVVMEELIDILEQHYGIDLNDLVQKHRLQAFSPKYFTDKNFFSYSDTQKKVSQRLDDSTAEGTPFFDEKLPEPDEEWKRLSINNLISFFQHPAKFLLQHRLGIYLQEEEVITDDREPFVLSGLESYQVGQELLDRFFKNKSLDDYHKNVQARDLLPEGWSGERAFNKQVHEVKEFGHNIKEVLDQQHIEDLEVDINVGDFHVVGTLSDMYQKARISYRFGSMRPKDVIDLWIQHLLLQKVKPDSHPGISRLFTRHKRKSFVEHRLRPVENSELVLEQLLERYWQGLQDNCYFFPDASFAYAEKVCFNNEDKESGLSKAYGKWKREYSSYPGEGEDPYNKLLLGDKNPLETEQFQKVSELFWDPFFESIIGEL